MKKIFVVIISAFVVLIALAIGGLYLWDYQRDVRLEKVEERRQSLQEITGEECAVLGGEIVNTLGKEELYSGEKVIGAVTDMRCPCVCIKKEKDEAVTSTGSGYTCTKHDDCPVQTLEDCGGELCAPQFIPFCDNGQCRAPQNDIELETACKDIEDFLDKLYCFNFLTSKGKEQDGFAAAFAVCNRNFENGLAEACRLDVCGYRPAYPTISPGEPECIEQALSSSCSDGIANGRETDIDCGGFECQPCMSQSRCSNGSDCQSGICGVHGTKNGDRCYDICPDGLVADNEPCGCAQEITPQGRVNETPVLIDSDVGSAESWEKQYGNGKRVYCCDGLSNYLLPGNDCTTVSGR